MLDATEVQQLMNDVNFKWSERKIFIDDGSVSMGMKCVPFMGIEKCTTHNQNGTS